MSDFFISSSIGAGSDTRENARRPDLFDYAKAAGQAANVVCDGGTMFLVKSDGLKASGPFEPLDPSHMIMVGAPDDGETDLQDVARKIGRYFLLRQLVGDLSDRNANASTIIAVKGIDTKDLTAQSKVGDYLALVLPQIELPLDARPQSKGGTFTDNFDGAGSNTDLAAWTPSGGGAWTRTGGSTNDTVVAPDGNVWSNTGSGSGAIYRCTDQASADQYLQVVLADGNGHGGLYCNRASDELNYIGGQYNAGFLEIWKRNAGTFTELGFFSVSTAANDVIRLESSGNNHTLYRNAGAVISPVSDAFNNTVTRQGINGRDDAATNPWLKSFEAGTIGGGAPALFPPFPQFQPSTHLRM